MGMVDNKDMSVTEKGYPLTNRESHSKREYDKLKKDVLIYDIKHIRLDLSSIRNKTAGNNDIIKKLNLCSINDELKSKISDFYSNNSDSNKVKNNFLK